MALNTSKCNHLPPLPFIGLTATKFFRTNCIDSRIKRWRDFRTCARVTNRRGYGERLVFAPSSPLPHRLINLLKISTSIGLIRPPSAMSDRHIKSSAGRYARRPATRVDRRALAIRRGRQGEQNAVAGRVVFAVFHLCPSHHATAWRAGAQHLSRRVTLIGLVSTFLEEISITLLFTAYLRWKYDKEYLLFWSLRKNVFSLKNYHGLSILQIESFDEIENKLWVIPKRQFGSSDMRWENKKA